ncbi:single-stranded DNA-binding protein [Corynebacterium pygosceleis]|uniref:single-stranded DNA-binding protein n=1 Tax=Corynebacterium pygosceleis TaxID=2800406 RepID=UPI002002C7D9|nr:single-stranded DNA-binding protein [Corynebacterium pygosceleis]MCK7676424.1 single-stranded DNA-binding protein [Corynebacterium pygosceleis]
MSGEVPITFVGNLVADPELRFTQSGTAVANFRIASTPRRYDSQSSQWVDGEPVFMAGNIWRQAAENAVESLTKGMRVIVVGTLEQRSYETKEGEKRSVYEIKAEEIAPSLKYATAKVTRNEKGGGRSQGFGQQQAPQSSWSGGAVADSNETPPF